ncbi:hypothetical protein, partial [Enterobacter hormaechei]|uniref:hypothetical protein n=2 Tax=Enterobacter hormaechei TaxID=158836 RepID=UPI0035280F3B
SGTQQPDNSGTQQPDNSGTQQPDNSGTQQPDNSGTQQPDNSGTQQPDNSGTQQTGDGEAQKTDAIPTSSQENSGGQELGKNAKRKVTFYVKIDDDVFELIDKPSIVENGEVHVFCREREGMPEMQVPISDCTLHHASLTK